ncbi:MAG TPA: hypothetical protein VJ227_00795 [Patescibacteria group bacterium]|nr:hypothetical protein [Patescibacteria group bacterium]
MERDAEYNKLREAFGYFGDLDEQEEKPKRKGKVWKFDIEINNNLDSLFSELAKEKGISKSEVMANALASYVWLQKELESDAEHPEKHLVIRNDEEIIRRIDLP